AETSISVSAIEVVAEPQAETKLETKLETILETQTETGPKVESLVKAKSEPPVEIMERCVASAVMPEQDRVFRRAFEYASIPAALITTKGECLYVNRPLRELLGYTVEEFKSFTIQTFLHPDDVSEF